MDAEHDWMHEAKKRGLGRGLSILLDVLEPFGPLGAQILWVVQPVSGLLGISTAVGELANALEQPGGVDELRRQLDERG